MVITMLEKLLMLFTDKGKQVSFSFLGMILELKMK